MDEKADDVLFSLNISKRGFTGPRLWNGYLTFVGCTFACKKNHQKRCFTWEYDDDNEKATVERPGEAAWIEC